MNFNEIKNKIINYYKSNKIKFISICIVAFFALLYLCGSLLSCIDSSSIGNQAQNNTHIYSYTNSAGEVSTFEINLEEGTYKYVGNNIPSSGYFKGMLQQGTSMEVSGYLYYEKTVNGWKYYSCYNHPWNDYYMIISEDESKLTFSNTLISMLYEFVLQN